jgi:hypothetical protein
MIDCFQLLLLSSRVLKVLSMNKENKNGLT